MLCIYSSSRIPILSPDAPLYCMSGCTVAGAPHARAWERPMCMHGLCIPLLLHASHCEGSIIAKVVCMLFSCGAHAAAPHSGSCTALLGALIPKPLTGAHHLIHKASPHVVPNPRPRLAW